jgi:hypothetical protein
MLRFGSILPRTKAGFGVKSRIKRSRKCTNFRGKSSQKDKDTNDDVNDENDINEDVSYTEDEEFFENVNTSPFLRPAGAPILANTTDPTVWKLMQKVLKKAQVRDENLPLDRMLI